MKKIVLVFALGSLFLTGCPKHEIIPAPEPRVDLTANFIGNINGTDVELTENVNGYYLEATKTKIILPSPNPSSAVYYADMKSGQTMVSVKIGLGSIFFDASISSDPTLSLFNSFFTAASSVTPSYSASSVAGFEVIYRDGTGAVWTSDPTSSPQNVVFSNIVQESDATGDYSKFVCTFDCIVYRTVVVGTVSTTYSLPIQNATFKGWFKR
jgi:hypothetical protein